jgi:hypothetical protein
MPAIPGSLPASRSLIVGVAVWSIAILAIVSGVLGLAGEADRVLPVLLIVGGTLGLSTVAFRSRRTVDAVTRLSLDRRALGAALAVGVGVGFAQAVPLMLLPVVFQYPLAYGTPMGIVAIAPFAVALLLTGPIAGILIRRFGPRGMMSGGTLALGIANILLALVLIWIAGQLREAFDADPGRTDTGLPAFNYLLFILPLVLVGGGFVLSTTVRTAIVFASTPLGLPASAAAINEASVGLGSRIGIVTATGALAITALGSARGMVKGQPAAQAKALVDEFELTLTSLGTPRFQEVYGATLEGTAAIKRAAYGVAYLDGVVVALAICGVVGVGAAILAWLMIGRRDPLQTVFDMREERAGESKPGRSPEDHRSQTEG